VRDVWKSALEWYIYCGDPSRKAKYALLIMAVKDRLSEVRTKSELVEHYMNTDGLCETVVAEVLPGEQWLDIRQTEDVAYGLRCLELSTGKRFDLMRRQPSRWLIETVA
jgi:hypothetical protein